MPRVAKMLTAAIPALLLLLAACGSDPTATPRPTATSAPTPTPLPASEPTPTPDAMAMFEAEWDALIAAAQAEGTITFMTAGGAANRAMRPVVEYFAGQFDVDFTLSSGSGSSQAERLFAEQQAGKYEVDVILGGANTANVAFIPNNSLAPIQPILIHPQVVNTEYWWQDRLWYGDTDGTYVFTYATSVNPILDFMYNTDVISEADIASLNSVWDILDERFVGLIGDTTPTYTGSHQWKKFVHPDIGDGAEWVRRWYCEMDLAEHDDQSLITDGVAFGKYGIAMPSGARRDLARLAPEGVPVKRFFGSNLTERAELAGQSTINNIFWPRNAPHPKAAQLFINWFLSKEGQSALQSMAADSTDQTLRVEPDIPTDKVDPLSIRKPGGEYIFFELDPSMLGRMDGAIQAGKAIYESCNF